MSRKRFSTKVRLAYTVGHRVQLRTGHDFFRTGFGDLHSVSGAEIPTVLKDMRDAWPELRDVVTDTHRQHAGMFTRAWAYWKFDKRMSAPPRDLVEQKRLLIENNWLTEEEKRALG